MFANEWMNTCEQIYRKKQFIEQILHFPHSYGNNSLKQKTLISICSCMGWTVQGSEQAQPYKQGCKQPLHTSSQGSCGEAFMHSWQLSTCERTEMIWGLFTHSAWGIWKHPWKNHQQLEGPGQGIVTATADEGFPTPSSSGREASGAEKNPTNNSITHFCAQYHSTQPLGVIT